MNVAIMLIMFVGVVAIAPSFRDVLIEFFNPNSEFSHWVSGCIAIAMLVSLIFLTFGVWYFAYSCFVEVFY